jgi:hypothetical protein
VAGWTLARRRKPSISHQQVSRARLAPAVIVTGNYDSVTATGDAVLCDGCEQAQLARGSSCQLISLRRRRAVSWRDGDIPLFVQCNAGEPAGCQISIGISDRGTQLDGLVA